MGPSNSNGYENRRKELVKRAVALAMHSRWSEAAETNLSILEEYPEDSEARNRLGKALTELGRIPEAREAFQRVLETSPHNTIARKNLDRLARLGDQAVSGAAKGSASPDAFVKDSGKSAVTSLVNLAPAEVLLKLDPGQRIQLTIAGSALKVVDSLDRYVGQIEPKTAFRLSRLLEGGNRYEATVTSVGEDELTIIIRETYRHPSQAGMVSFPPKGGAEQRVSLPATVVGYELGEETEPVEPVVVKDWSDDDTEPGDDEAFTPVLHRIISTSGDNGQEEEQDY